MKSTMYSREQRRKFQELFGQDIRTYWDNLVGFDVVKFDEEFVKPRNGQSTKQKVKDKYGEEGVELVVSLIQLLGAKP